MVKYFRAALLMGTAIWLTASVAGAQVKLQPENVKEFEDLLRLQNTQKSLSLKSFIAPQAPETTLQRLFAWHRIALETTALDHTPVEPGTGDDPRRFAEQLGPHRSSYAMAIVHIAMFEAVNATFQRYKSYTGLKPIDKKYISSKVLLDRAIAESAHDALLSLYPYQKDRLDGLLSTDIARMPKGPADEVALGASLGADAARSIIQKRENDGSSAPEPQYGKDFIPNPCPGVSGPCPGTWTPDPVSGLTVALGANWSRVRPFVVKSADQFRPPAPPPLNSAEYATAYNDVIKVGGDGKTTATSRRDFETFEGLFWAYDGTAALCAPPRLYNQIADTVALKAALGDVDDFARFFAILNTAMADAAISAWEAKYYYQLWRPVTAIRNADKVNNPGTKADPNWTPLGAPATNGKGPNFTPPFPAYPSGHAVFGGAVFGILRHFTSNDTPFTFVSDEYNGLNYPVGGTEARPNLPQSFVSLSHAEYANGRSRIWLGIHWQNDADNGIRQGNQIANYVFANAFQPQ